MLKVLKSAGLGILYLIATPFALLFLVLVAVGLFFVYFFRMFANIINFFKGKDVKNDELPEDIEARRILEENAIKQAALAQAVQNTMSNMVMNQMQQPYPQQVPVQQPVDNMQEILNSINAVGGENND